MRKRILAVLSSCLLLLLCGCQASRPDAAPKAPPVFESGEHAWSSDYKQRFDTRCAKIGEAEFHVQSAIFEQEAAGALYAAVERDLQTMQTAFGRETAPKIYVVSKLETGAQAVRPGELVCTAEEITAGSYRNGLAAAALGLSEPWQSTGAVAFAFGEKPDTKSLAAYYAEAEDLSALTLFAGYFCKEFTGKETRQTAEDTAAAFTRFLMEQHGTEAFLTCGFSQTYRQEWLESLGVSRTYAPPCDLDFLTGMSYASSADWPLIAKTEDRIFQFQSIPGDLETPLDVLLFLSGYAADMDALLRRIETEAPEAYAAVAAKWAQQFTYAFSMEPAQSGSNTFRCTSSDVAVFRTVSSLLPVARDNAAATYWLFTGLCTYFQTCADPYLAEMFRLYHSEQARTSKDNWAFLTRAREYYCRYAPSPETKTLFDSQLFFRAIAATVQAYPEQKNATNFTYTVNQMMYGAGAPAPLQGNELPAYTAYAFTAYLVETYGLAPALNLCMQPNLRFSSAFGVSYETALDAFYASLA